MTLLASGHAQTVFGRYSFRFSVRDQAIRHRVPVSEGDQIVLHANEPSTVCNSSRNVLLVHGLGGCHASGYMRRIASKLCSRGFRAFRIDLRGTGAGSHLSSGVYHAGCSADVAKAIEYVARQCPDSPTSLVGFSLGGNVALKLACDIGRRRVGNLDSIFAVAPPIDLAECVQSLDQGWGPVYQRRFLAWLLKQLHARAANNSALRHVTKRATPRSLWEFDDRITAPLNGFLNAHDYYQACSTVTRLSEIRLPALIMAADDDPLVPSGMFRRASISSTTRLHITDSGGHLGYIGTRNSDPDRRWLDWRIVNWAKSLPSAL